jgi:hypothetical protein
MTIKKSSSSYAACVLDCGGHDAALGGLTCVRSVGSNRSAVPRLIQPIPSCPNLSQQFLEKKDCLNSLATLRAFAPWREAHFGRLWSATVGIRADWESARRICSAPAERRSHGDRASGRERVHSRLRTAPPGGVSPWQVALPPALLACISPVFLFFCYLTIYARP